VLAGGLLRWGGDGNLMRRWREDGLGPALEISAALPMITAGADVYVARGLVVSR
jgi:hypothetical protein